MHQEQVKILYTPSFYLEIQITVQFKALNMMNKETRALEDGAEDSRQMYFLLYEKKLIVKIIKNKG